MTDRRDCANGCMWGATKDRDICAVCVAIAEDRHKLYRPDGSERNGSGG